MSSPRGEDLIVELLVAGIRGDPLPAEVLELQRRQHAHHHQLGVVPVDPRVGDVQRRAQGAFELERPLTDQRTRPDVHLDVELTELGLEHGVVVDRLEDGEIGHRGRHVGVDEIELDLHAQHGPGRVDLVDERSLPQHSLERVDAHEHLLPEQAPVFSGECPRRHFATHTTPQLRVELRSRGAYPFIPRECGMAG